MRGATDFVATWQSRGSALVVSLLDCIQKPSCGNPQEGFDCCIELSIAIEYSIDCRTDNYLETVYQVTSPSFVSVVLQPVPRTIFPVLAFTGSTTVTPGL